MKPVYHRQEKHLRKTVSQASLFTNNYFSVKKKTPVYGWERFTPHTLTFHTGSSVYQLNTVESVLGYHPYGQGKLVGNYEVITQERLFFRVPSWF